MSRAFWYTAFTGAGFTGAGIYSWADTRTDAQIILTGFIWALFLLALIDIARTTPRPPTPRNP